MNVKLISITPNAEQIVGYCARVSNPSNQENPEVSKLLAYCIRHGHWSIFEMANMVLEIETSRAISAQILRHRSFSFQEFSQRYAIAQEFELYDARRQDIKNRQNSVDDLPEYIKTWFHDTQISNWEDCYRRYDMALNLGIAKEQARMFLPLGTKTRLYMNGTIRSWIHYIQLRTDTSTQQEHREVAEEAKKIFIKELPIISAALGWNN